MNRGCCLCSYDLWKFYFLQSLMAVCKAIKMGKLDQNDLTKKAGMDMLKQSFKEQLKKNKK